MLVDPRTVRAVASEIADAANGVIEDYAKELVVDEPEITNQMLGAIRDRLKSREIGGIVWNARVVRSGRGTADEEGQYGADFFGVLDIDLSTFVVKKGFLAQAKRAEPGDPFTNHEWGRLMDQCNKMLAITPDAFVVVYSQARGVCFVPAIEVLGSGDRDLFSHYTRRIQPFFELFIECFVGDHRLHSPDIQVLKDLRATHGLELTARAFIT